MELSRDGPGLLLRDVLRGEEADIAAVLGTVASAAPDILLLTGFDWDHEGRALGAFAQRLAEAGHPMPHSHAPRPNSGWATGIDMDGDGRSATADDAHGWGRFSGQGGMALLSRWPIGAATDHSRFLWRDLPGAMLTRDDGTPLLGEAAAAIQRLSSTGHWTVPVETPAGRIALLAYSATPPVFDGPEDRNGRRANDETAFWLALLDGALPIPPPEDAVVVIGNANLDPQDGEGPRAAIRALLSHPRLQDARPRSDRAAEAALRQGGVNAGHRGDPALDTADWSDDGPGNLRVSYVLPDVALTVRGAGVLWPGTASDGGSARPRHGLVFVDIDTQSLAQGVLD